MRLPRKHDCHRNRLFLLVAALLCLSSARAQQPPGADAQIEGVVHDASGSPIPGAFLHLEAADHTSSHGTTTDGVGHFSIPGLHSGKYSIRVKKLGFRDSLDDTIELAPAQKKHCEFVLEVPAPKDFAGLVQLDDRPNFAVSGLSDSTGSGGHGSETRMRTGEALAKETVALESAGAKASDDPRQAREQVLQELAANKNLTKPDQGELRRRLGDLDEKLEDPLDAEHEYERAVDLDASEANYFAWGGELLLHRATSQAIEVFEKGAKLHPDSARMLAGLGAALYSSGAIEDGASKVCQASDLDPANSAPYLFLGRIQEAVSTPLSCVEEKLSNFVRQQPENALANYYDALALGRRRRGGGGPALRQRQQSLLEKAVALNPKLDAAYIELGNLQAEQNEITPAVTSYQKAIAANPASSQAHYRLGLAYKRSGEAEKAQAEFEQFKQLDQAETAAVERQRREVKQFLFTLKDDRREPGPTSTAAPN